MTQLFAPPLFGPQVGEGKSTLRIHRRSELNSSTDEEDELPNGGLTSAHNCR